MTGPGQAAEEQGREPTKSGIAGLAAAAQVGTILRGVPDGGFDSLSGSLQRKFMDAGLRPEHGIRSAAEAQALYQESVPGFVRNYGEDAVRQFLQGKDASHIRSVHNAPQLATDSGNILWESSGINRARGAADMTGAERSAAQMHNTFDAAAITMRECATAAGTSAAVRRTAGSASCRRGELHPLSEGGSKRRAGGEGCGQVNRPARRGWRNCRRCRYHCYRVGRAP